MVPCYNEDKSLEASIQSCLAQNRPFDELVFIDDCSKDGTAAILAKYADRITAHRTPSNSGNKSSAQEFGLTFITGDVVVTTDADTLLDPNFSTEIEKSFMEHPEAVAVAGYVRSIPHNWLTLCRAYEYAVGQNIHKTAQHYLNYIFVMPGAASAFRTEIFRKHVTFDHDTLTEDLDFTYKIHQQRLKIVFNRDAVSHTQDPATLHDYINQTRRWFGGGWQNLMKHYLMVPLSPIRSLELSLLYAEGVLFSFLIFLIPLLNPWYGLWLLIGYLGVSSFLGVFAAYVEKRPMLALAPLLYIPLLYVNAFVYIEQFTKEVILRRKNLVWFKPERVAMPAEA